MSFTKTCKICGATFESDARNTIYCSDKCAKRGAKKSYRSRKMKHINAVRRGDDKEIENLMSTAYHLAREVAKMCLIKKCSCTDPNHICEGELHCHHINHNIFDNRPQNLQWLCEKAHHEIHSQEEDVSITDEIKAFVTIRKQGEIRERNLITQKKRENDFSYNKCDLTSETHSVS
jgi:hypothetical protein